MAHYKLLVLLLLLRKKPCCNIFAEPALVQFK